MKAEQATVTERTSVVLQQLVAGLPQEEEVRIGAIVHQLRRRSFGGLLLILAVLGLLPGISIFAGLVMLVPGLQMAIGFQAPVLPRFIRDRQVNVAAIRAITNRVIPWIVKAEKYIKPRWVDLTRPPAPMIVGALTVGLALIVMLPLPFSNLPPALALICFSLGLLERDGLLTIVGLGLALLALTIGVVMGGVAWDAMRLLIEQRSN